MKAKILIVWLIFYLLGSLLAVFLSPLINTYLAIGLCLFLVTLLTIRKPLLIAAVCGLGLFFLSVSRFQADAKFFADQNANYANKSTTVQALVVDLPQTVLHGQKVRLRVFELDGGVVNFDINGYVNRGDIPKYGEVITATVKISPYKEENRWKLIKQKVLGETTLNEYSVIGESTDLWVRIKGSLLSLRETLNQSIAKQLPAAEAGLGSGIILGEKAALTPEMTRSLQVSGTTHIIALSGYNITIILGLFILFRNKWSRLANLLVPVGFISAFVIMTGGAPSLVRAAIMGFLPLLARFLYRESDSFIAILLSATVMVVANPFLPLFDVGFQLSFLAFAGIIYISPIIKSGLVRIGASISTVLSETVGAQLATLPLLSYYFGMISVISPLTNMIILGILPVCMALTFMMGVGGIIWEPAGALLSVPTYYLLHFVNSVISWSGNIGWASVVYKIENPWWILICYLGLFIFWLFFYKVGRTRPTE